MYIVVQTEQQLSDGEEFDTLCDAVGYLNTNDIEGRVYYCYRDALGSLHVSHMVHRKEYLYAVS